MRTFQTPAKITGLSRVEQSYWDSIRIAEIIQAQKILIKKFIKTKDRALVLTFRKLAAEFQEIHERHQENY
jgi:hypothetical protein